MIKVEFTDDAELIRNTITHPSVYKFVSDDTCPDVENFNIPEINGDFFCASCTEDGIYMGCFCFVKKSDEEAEIHTCLLPAARGKSTLFGMAVLRLVFNMMNFSKISTFIPINNILAKKLAIKCGFLVQKEDKPLIIGGIEIPVFSYAINRGDVCL